MKLSFETIILIEIAIPFGKIWPTNVNTQGMYYFIYKSIYNSIW